MSLRAGAAEVVITPPLGTPLAGYGGRAGGAVGVHDELQARALVVDDGATQAAIVSCDLVGVDKRLTAEVRRRAEASTGILGANIMFCATHTHAGPAGLRPDEDAALFDAMCQWISDCIEDAHRHLRPALLKVGHGAVDSVSQNRRDPSWQVDDAMTVLLFDSPDPREKPIASVVNFACHATVMFGTNMRISADYPGYAVAAVKKLLGDAPVLFLNGACADVNPVWIEQRFDEAMRIGAIVGAEAARRLLELRPLGSKQQAWNIRWDELTERSPAGVLVESPRIRVASRRVDAGLRRMGPPGEYDARIASLRDKLEALGRSDADARRALTAQLTMLAGERGVAERLRPGGSGRIPAEIQAIGFGGGCAVLGLPGEFFVETGRAIRDAAAGLPHLALACYANHYLYYIVPKEAFGQGGYEPGVAVLDEEAEPLFRDAVAALLSELTA